MASTAFGLDVTRFLEETRVPLHPFTRGIADRLSRLPPLVQSDFEQRGIVRKDGPRIEPNWTLKSTIHWRQVFEPGQAIRVALAYQPVAAEARFSAALLETMRVSHCIDQATETAITRKVAQSGGNVVFRWLTYGLTTGSQWQGEIASFRLLVEKPDIATLVATCRKGLRQPGPTALEWSATAFHPDDDISLLFIQ